MIGENLDRRALQVLRDCVLRYIEDGQPVASKALAEDSELMLSAASIRHIMSDLEKAGYLQSPHTSSGRIPTVQGYRLFVDKFLSVHRPTQREIERLRQEFNSGNDEQTILTHASQLLSGITELVGIVSLPRRDEFILKQVEFLPLSDHRVLVIIVLEDDHIQNRIFRTERFYSPKELQQAGQYLSQRFVGRNLKEIRQAMAQEIRADQACIEKMLQTVTEMIEDHCQKDYPDDYILTGEVNLFDIVQDKNNEKLKELFAAFSQKRDVLRLLNQAALAKDIQIFIGEESGYDVFNHCSMITAPYSINNQVVGVLGVVGPIRMNYCKVISIVDATAKLLGQALETRDDED